MPDFRHLAAACAFAATMFAPYVACQDRSADEQQLLDDLGHFERRLDSIRKLVRLGPRGVELLQAGLRQDALRQQPETTLSALYALGRLGQHATPAVEQLLDIAAHSRPPELNNAFWALGEIGPHLGAGRAALLQRLQPMKPEPGWAHQEWAFACRRIELGNGLDFDEIDAQLREVEHASQVAAAEVLRQWPPGKEIPEDALRSAWTAACDQWQHEHEGCRRRVMALSRVMAHHFPRSETAAAANRILLEHWEEEVRLHAVMELGRSPGTAVKDTVGYLQKSLHDGSPLVRREAVTALGMLGADAAPATDDLRALTHDDDRQIRARAEAALRSIERSR